MNPTQQTTPPIVWDGSTFHINLKAANIEAKWTPDVTFVIRVREVGKEWSVGFETPLTGCSLNGLAPDTDYEMEVRTKQGSKLGSPTKVRIRPDSSGVFTQDIAPERTQ